jgi:hypothetical protein
LGKLWRVLVRFGLWWAGLFGWIGMGNCPCCGQPACPHSLAGSGLMAAMAAGVMFLFSGKRRKARKSIADREEEHRHREASA